MPNGRTLIIQSQAIVAIDVLGALDSAGPAQLRFADQGVHVLDLTALSDQESPAWLSGALPPAVLAKTAELLAIDRGQAPAFSPIGAVHHARPTKPVPFIHEGG